MTATLSPELRQWLIEQAIGGLSPEKLIAPLVREGMSPSQAANAVEAVVREHLSAHARDNDLPASVPVPAPAVLNGIPTVTIQGHQISVLAQLLHPRIIVFGQIVTTEECRSLIELASPLLRLSTVVDPVTGGDQLHEARTSVGAMLPRAGNSLICRLEQRFCELLRWPISRAEALQVLRYDPDAEYQPHYDYFDTREPGNAAQLARGGQRVASLVIYLSSPESGGATVFPDIHFEVAPIRGNAVFFSYDRPHPMTRTLHGGAPVARGEKWIATLWLRERDHV